jgi:anti-sigma factor (TIGR02949 family)
MPVADCNETLRELEAFLDDELSDDNRDQIHAHLGGCPDCHQAFDFHAELKAVIAEKCRQDELPPALAARIRACLDLEPAEAFDDSGRQDATG